MTLVELMIVVVVIGILAALAVVGYRKYIARARLSEANAMLAEFVAKEQLFFLDNGVYLSAHADATAAEPAASENPGDFWPHNPLNTWDSAREAAPVLLPTGLLPASWRRLGVRTRWNQLFCTYLVNSGTAGTAPPGPVGATVWSVTPNVPWFYAVALCNLVGQAGWDTLGQETTLILSHDSPAIRTIEEAE
jgi:prepilin-type N-terminal cleavage/methylation domain-containing protein